MTPSIGRVVHFGHPIAEKGGPVVAEAWAAIVTKVHDDLYVNLRVFHPTFKEDEHREHVSFSVTLEPYCWSWPPRVG